MAVTNLIIAIASASMRLTPVCTLPVDQFTSSSEYRAPSADPTAYYQLQPNSLLFKEPCSGTGPEDNGDRLCLALEILSSNEVRYVRGADAVMDCFNITYRPSDFLHTPIDSISWEFDEIVPASAGFKAKWPNATSMRLRWSVGINPYGLVGDCAPIKDEPETNVVRLWTSEAYVDEILAKDIDWCRYKSVNRLDEDNYRAMLLRVPDEDVKTCATLACVELARRLRDSHPPRRLPADRQD